ncbi:MAG: ABC transporter permease, partial [Acidobacteria bacterium]|nr:ABC transporter permease [Acidobacteriota bacterium]
MDMFPGLWRDLVLAGRSLARARAFTFVCVVSLGVGMAPVIAVPYGSRIFTAPPVGLQTDTLIELVTTPAGPRQATTQWSYPDYVDLSDATTGVSLIGWATATTDEGMALFVSLSYFATLGVPLAQGAGFPGTADPTVILSHAYWQRHQDGDPVELGTSLTIDHVPHTVVAIAPEHFGGHLGFHDVDFFLPLDRHPLALADATVRFDRSKEWVNIHGRLQPGVALTQANAAVGALTAQLAQDHPDINEHKSGVVEPYHAIGTLQASQLTIVKAVAQALTALPLLVVCLNIAGMVQVRSAMRERELSIRQAIGATRGRLMQQLLAESVILAALGATLASCVLFNLAPLAAWWFNDPLPPRIASVLQVDASMIAVSVGLCLGAALLFGWLPASRFSRPAIITVLKDDAGGGRARVGRVHRVATALQVAIATPLLVLSGMTLDRVRATATNDLGFAVDALYAAPLNLDSVGAENAWIRMQGVRETVAGTGGVAAVTIADGLPLDFRYRITRVATQEAEGTAPKVVAAHVTRVGDDYLDTMGIPLVRGRAF